MSVGQVHLYVRDRDFRALGKGSHALKQVLERLAWFADEDGMSVFPKMQTIADALGVTKRGVRFRMRALEEKGFVTVVEEARQHRPRVYRIDVDKILGLPLTETGRNRLARETLAAPKDPAEPGGKSTSSGESRGEKSVAQGGNLGYPGGKSTSPHIDEESLQESKQESSAREAGGAHGPGGADAPPACAVWRDNQAALEALASWPLLERAIPDHDDGEVLTLAVEAPVVGFAILAWAAREAEAVLGRRLACRVRRWVQPSLIQRGIQKVGATDASAHRRDGEIVTLQDPAWRMWQAKATELGAPEIGAITALCLPDDLDQTGLTLFVGSVAIANMLAEDGGKAVARVLGVPIRTRFLWCMDMVLDARAAADRGETGLQGREAI
ncbi:MAG TPA: hypothetical protein ENH55_08335 [Aurantimonas coralicida]|uniref:Helix-turn-helix domain-containing protein n=2 Tax=root TaxID=1 RepID=A0A9C9TJ16_9HYPH|nr:hypothetical protein [Aurantimonas coralicida]HEU02929.1 hypothetical protein [Aurantimonas coralicida]